MELFELDVDYGIKLNRTWLWMIPEFAEILKRDKGSTGDKGGQRKLWARKRFAYIYFAVDFQSPIYAWEEPEKTEEALRYTGLEPKDLKEDYMISAINLYKELQRKAARSLRTLEAVHAGLSKLNEYFEEIDFSKTDKMGKSLYSSKEYIDNISRLNKAFDELNAFEKRVMAELTKSGGIRGTATKGDRENESGSNTGKETRIWNESAADIEDTVNWMNMNTGTSSKDTFK